MKWRVTAGKTDVCSDGVNLRAALSRGQISSCCGRRSRAGRAPYDTTAIWSLNHSPVQLRHAAEGQQMVPPCADAVKGTQKGLQVHNMRFIV